MKNISCIEDKLERDFRIDLPLDFVVDNSLPYRQIKLGLKAHLIGKYGGVSNYRELVKKQNVESQKF